MNLRKVSVPWMRTRCPKSGSCSRSSQKVICNKRLGSCDALIHACFACYLQPTLFEGVHVPRLFISDQLSQGAMHVMSPNCHLHACGFEHSERPDWIVYGWYYIWSGFSTWQDEDFIGRAAWMHALHLRSCPWNMIMCDIIVLCTCSCV